MRVRKWTATSIEALPARSTPYGDPAQPCLELLVRERKTDRPSRVWYARMTFRTEKVHCPIGRLPDMSLEAARAEVRRLRELAGQGIDPRRASSRRAQRDTPKSLSSAAAGNEHAIESVASRYIERAVKRNHKDPAYTERALAKDVLTEFKGRDIRTITRREVATVLNSVADRAPVMANRLRTMVDHLFEHAVDNGMIDENPVSTRARPGGTEKPRQRALSDAELKAFLSDPLACTRHARLATVITILLATAQRRGELALARWSHINLDEGTWRVPPENSKNGRESIVPLSDLAIAEFRKLKNTAARSPWVLPGSDPSKPLEPKLLTRGLAKCLARFKKAGIAAFTLHDLRRTARTGLARLQIPPHISERVLNHVQSGVAGVYDTYTYATEKREALDKWAAHLRSLAGSSAAV